MNRRQIQGLYIAADEHSQALQLLGVMYEAAADDTMRVLVRRCQQHIEAAHSKISAVILEEAAKRG